MKLSIEFILTMRSQIAINYKFMKADKYQKYYEKKKYYENIMKIFQVCSMHQDDTVYLIYLAALMPVLVFSCANAR